MPEGPPCPSRVIRGCWQLLESLAHLSRDVPRLVWLTVAVQSRCLAELDNNLFGTCGGHQLPTKLLYHSLPQQDGAGRKMEKNCGS